MLVLMGLAVAFALALPAALHAGWGIEGPLVRSELPDPPEVVPRSALDCPAGDARALVAFSLPRYEVGGETMRSWFWLYNPHDAPTTADPDGTRTLYREVSRGLVTVAQWDIDAMRGGAWPVLAPGAVDGPHPGLSWPTFTEGPPAPGQYVFHVQTSTACGWGGFDVVRP